jgi:hypothetical protein
MPSNSTASSPNPAPGASNLPANVQKGIAGSAPGAAPVNAK